MWTHPVTGPLSRPRIGMIAREGLVNRTHRGIMNLDHHMPPRGRVDPTRPQRPNPFGRTGEHNRRSMAEFGLAGPVLLGKDGVIIAGPGG